MRIDAHAHLGKWYFPIDELSSEKMRESMNLLGVDVTIVSHSLALTYDICEGNQVLATILEKHPGSILGYVTVNLNYPEESVVEMRKYLNGTRGFVGVKVHPLLNDRRFDTREGRIIAEAAAELDAPVLIHTFGSDIESPRHAAAVARKVPELRIILGHMGGFSWSDGIQAAEECDRIWMEICSTANEPAKIEESVRIIGPERLLMGTDSTLFLPEYNWGQLWDADIDPRHKDMIAGLNAAGLFGLEKNKGM